MKLEHLTGMQTGYTMGMDKQGREHLVVCIKGTFDFPQDGNMPKLAKEQVPIVEADTFAGEPGYCAPLYESDYAPVKPRCDVLLNGKAYAPEGKPVTNVPVTLQFGQMKKSFNVVGDRVWQCNHLSVKPSPTKPFLHMPITYDRAFGGVDKSRNDPKKVRAVMENPVGVGYHYHTDKKAVDGRPLPNTEEPHNPITNPAKQYRPMGFGPIGRGWLPRASLAGTYDQNWIDNFFPFLPPDFDNAYFQSAPADQQVPYPQGGERIMLSNLTPRGQIAFPFPKIDLMVWFFYRDGKEKEKRAMADTVILEPDEARFTVTCRASLPLKKNMLEMEMAVVGHAPEDVRGWDRKDEMEITLMA
jgi:hypothetical protein